MHAVDKKDSKHDDGKQHAEVMFLFKKSMPVVSDFFHGSV